MKPLSIPYLIGFLIAICCNYAQAQTLQISSNPTTCNGSQGSITFSGLTPSTSYQISYDDDGVTIGPVTIASNAAGQLTITGLNEGLYEYFIFNLGGTITQVTTGTFLSNPRFTPTFNTMSPICAGKPPPVLPTTSNNGISGTWNPAVVDNQTTGTYVFTPNPGTCGRPLSVTIVVDPPTVPAFPFPSTLTICGSGTVPVLPNTSLNGITGFWSPAVVDPNNSGTYIFTPTTTGCVTGASFTVTVNPNITPTFPFRSTGFICTGEAVPTLPNTSNNGITGTWSPAVVSNTSSGIYTFTPDAGQCAIRFTYIQTVNPIITPTFDFGPTLTICSGGTVPVLPTTSTNGITGVWTPAVVSNTASGTYMFKSSSDPCAPPVTFMVTVNPIITPAFTIGTFQSDCIYAPAPVLPAVSTNGVSGTWTPAVVDNQNTGTFTYTFTPNAGECANSTTFTYEVNLIPSVTNFTSLKDTTVYDGAIIPGYNFNVAPTGGIRWSNTNVGIGLPAAGTGHVPSFTATNMTDAPITGVVTATPFINGCSGASISYRVTVLPLNKDVFVPNAFSPNGDGKNDLLFVYGNYIESVEMHIFNQWGERLFTITNKNQGWDGKYKGSSQPVGVYVYVLRAVTTDGRKVNMKGSITLVR